MLKSRGGNLKQHNLAPRLKRKKDHELRCKKGEKRRRT